MHLQLATEQDTIDFGQALAEILTPPCLVYLSGDLGAGKTTLVRAFLRALGVKGPVKSPTFSMIEPYQLGQVELYHFDLYRLADPEELEFLGFRDYCHDQSLILIEWPEKAKCLLPNPDILINLSRAELGRTLTYELATGRGKALAPLLQTIIERKKA